MSHAARTAVSNTVIVISLAIMLFILVYVSVQNRTIIERIEEQGQINQRYIRCIVLTPGSEYSDVGMRTKAIDKCAIESKLPPKE